MSLTMAEGDWLRAGWAGWFTPIQHWWHDRIRMELIGSGTSEARMLLLAFLGVPSTCRKAVEKLGVARILEVFNWVKLSEQGDYMLIQIWQMKFLKMKNPSTGEWHLEAVHPACVSVETALDWRNCGWFIHAAKLT